MIERLFDYREVTITPAPPLRIAELQQRVHRMQGTTTARTLETLPAFVDMVQLRTGSTYGVDSPTLAMALMAGPSRAGSWSAVVGAADFGIEAAAGFGIDLDRTILVPDPGAQWLNVVAGLIDVATVVVVRPPALVTEHQAAKLTSRLRQKDAVLVAWGDWPRCDARLSVHSSRWRGLGRGHGHLVGRQAVVTVRRGASSSRQATMWLPDVDQEVRLVEAPPMTRDGRSGRDVVVGFDGPLIREVG